MTDLDTISVRTILTDDGLAIQASMDEVELKRIQNVLAIARIVHINLPFDHPELFAPIFDAAIKHVLG